MSDNIATRDAFGSTLARLADTYEDIVVVDADLSAATRTGEFAEKYPNRAFNVGVAEQNMIGCAVGLASMGLIPFACTFAVFAAGRAYDQIRQSVAYPMSNVKIAATHGGLTVGEDGATHQSIEDIALMRVLPNMTVLVPADPIETERAVEAAIRHRGPVYLRLGREKLPIIVPHDHMVEIGSAVTLRTGEDITFVATGIMVAKAMEAAQSLEKQRNIRAAVIDVHTIKPLDQSTILSAAEKTGLVVTAEEHSVIGGLGSAVDELITQNRVDCTVVNVGIEDCFGQTGKADELLKVYRLTPQRLVDEATVLIDRRRG